MSRFARAIAAIDAANTGDPTTIVIDGVERAKEQAHAELMTEWVARLDPVASEAQLLAARAHHLRRWSIARDSYPDGRTGYLRWRAALKRQHAEETGAILADAGYDPGTIDRVQRIIRKEGLGTDPAVQTHEDALCLVFLRTQLDDLAGELGDERTIEVLAKTLTKMSEQGRNAVAGVPLTDRSKVLLDKAVAAG
jgi:hypothetical protein